MARDRSKANPPDWTVPEALATDQVVPLYLLAGCIAHDVSSPLTYVRWDVDALARLVESMRELAEDPAAGPDWGRAVVKSPRVGGMLAELPEMLKHVHAGLDRLQQLSADLTLLADIEQLEQPVDLREAVLAALRLSRPHVGRKFHIVTELGEAHLKVVGRLGDLVRILLKVVFDRARLVQDGDPPGRLSIRASRQASTAVLELADDRRGEGYAGADPTLSALVARQRAKMMVNADDSGTRISITLRCAD